MNLYQPEKYQVLLGKGSSIGFCTVWNEPELLFKRSEILREHSAILGTLYSRQGVNIIVRNLARNPGITKMFVWGNGLLSNTQFGMVGKSILEKLWRDGVEQDGTVRGTQFKLEKEIDLSVIEKIRAHVEFIDISEKSLEDAEELVEQKAKEKTEAYMEPVVFSDAVPEKVEVFPSEEVGWLIHGRTILDAWTRLVDRIMRYGTIKGTQYGYQQRELIGATWTIGTEDPTAPDLSIASEWPQDLQDTVGATAKAIAEYHAVFLSPTLPPGIVYTYGNRLMAYPSDGGPIDQVEEVLKKQLRASPDSRRATATTMVPVIDKDNKEPPCITQVQALQSRGKLHLLVTVRSHDIFKAAVPNAFGLRMLQKTIADDLGFELGKLQITSQSAHIYEQDWENAFKLVRCHFWEREPSLAFDQNTQADPRGMAVISLHGNTLQLVFQGPLGEELLRLEGTSAKQIAKKISQLELLSRTDHIFDIGMELQKAEIALQKKIPYHQDRPLII